MRIRRYARVRNAYPYAISYATMLFRPNSVLPIKLAASLAHRHQFELKTYLVHKFFLEFGTDRQNHLLDSI